MNTSEFIAHLKTALPDWLFQPYGAQFEDSGPCVAAYPPVGPRPARYRELAEHATISGVCGPLYVAIPKVEVEKI